MRSRYSAYALGELEYLRHSWHPATCPATLELESDIRWYRLDIVRTQGGGLFDDEGIVEFRAFFKSGEGPGDQHEVSRFVRLDGRWVYVDAA